jgi:hypothetical protein
MRSIANTIASLALFGAAGAQTNLVVNGGFETGDTSDWSVYGTDIFDMGVLHQDSFGTDDQTWVMYFGSVGGDGFLSQTLSNAPGSYTISYEFASQGGSPSDFGVYWDGTLVKYLTDPAPQDFEWTSLTVFGSGNDTLTFGARNDPYFLGLDNVRVISSATNTPSPAAALPMLGGLIGLARRRRK